MNYKQMYQDLVMTNYFMFRYNLNYSEEEVDFDMPN